MASIQEDTRAVREEFDGLSTPTQIFIATLVALGVLLGGVLGYNIAVNELDDADPPQRIEYRDNEYQLEGAGGEQPAGG